MRKKYPKKIVFYSQNVKKGGEYPRWTINVTSLRASYKLFSVNWLKKCDHEISKMQLKGALRNVAYYKLDKPVKWSQIWPTEHVNHQATMN